MAEWLKFNKRQAHHLATLQEVRKDQYLAFTMGGETFAMGIRSIKEVIQFDSLTKVPLMPPFLRGVINLRGAVVPVIDLLVRFGRAPVPVSRRTCVVILEVAEAGETAVLGVMVDNVSEVLEIGEDEIDPAPAFGSGIRGEFIKGVGKPGGKFVLLLDADRVLSVEEMGELAAAFTQDGPAGSRR
jgi:purine-binding chemotaxis protein CheW